MSISQRYPASTLEVQQTFVAVGVAFALQVALVIALTAFAVASACAWAPFAVLFLGRSLLAFFGIVWVFLPKYAHLPSLAVVALF